MPPFRIEFRFSTLFTMIMTLAVLFPGSAKIVSMTVGHSSHCRVQAGFTLLGPASIFAFISFMPSGYLPYFSMLTSSTHSRYHLWSPVKSIISASFRLSAIRMVSISVGMNVLLVAVIHSIPLRYPLSLNVGH